MLNLNIDIREIEVASPGAYLSSLENPWMQRALITAIIVGFICGIIGVFILSLFIKFFGAYFLLFYNNPFIEVSGVNDLIIIFPTALILTIVSFAIIMISTSVMKINFHEFEKRLITKKTQSALSTFKYGNSK